MMRLFRTLALTGLLAVAGTACADLEVTNLNNPDRDRAISLLRKTVDSLILLGQLDNAVTCLDKADALIARLRGD